MPIYLHINMSVGVEFNHKSKVWTINNFHNIENENPWETIEELTYSALGITVDVSKLNAKIPVYTVLFHSDGTLFPLAPTNQFYVCISEEEAILTLKYVLDWLVSPKIFGSALWQLENDENSDGAELREIEQVLDKYGIKEDMFIVFNIIKEIESLTWSVDNETESRLMLESEKMELDRRVVDIGWSALERRGYTKTTYDSNQQKMIITIIKKYP
jgi:hypothetical protein